MHQRKDFLKETKNTCPVCDLKFQSLAELKKHMLEKYSRQDSSSCSCLMAGCNKVIESSSMSSKRQLFYHHVLYEHYGSKYKLKCDFCPFRAISSSRLKDHLMLHADERPFTCSTCNHGFRLEYFYSVKIIIIIIYFFMCIWRLFCCSICLLLVTLDFWWISFVTY